MSRHHNKQKELESFVGTICPKIRKKVAKNADFANTCYVMLAEKGVFQVNSRDHQYIVDICSKECECRRWQLTRIPCSHGIACLRHERIPPESVVASCYTLELFGRAYASNIWPCRDTSEWKKVHGPLVGPPRYEKKVGRSTKARKKGPHEVQGRNGPKLSRHGVVIHCSWCKSTEHNARTCALKKAGIKPTAGNGSPPAPYVIEAEDILEQAEVEVEVDLTAAQANEAAAPTEVEGPDEMSQETMLSQFLSQVHHLSGHCAYILYANVYLATDLTLL